MGSDGVSLDIYQNNSGYEAQVTNMYNPFEPDITVSFSGCSNSTVVFSTTATGNINWIFGYGANPLTSSQASDTVEYDSGTPGFRTITLIVDGVPYSFANFINIRQDYTPPVISASDTIICSGTGLTLTTSNALSYNWSIPGGSVTSSTSQTPGTVNFAIAGNYTVTLTTTSCCGTHVATQNIYVIDFPPLDLGPDISICYTDPMPVLDAGNPGASYTWKFNNNPTGGNTQTLQTFQPGTYSVYVTYGACSSSDTLNLEIYTTLPVDLGDDIYMCPTGSFPVLDAGISGMTSYSWVVDGQPLGTNSQTLQTTVPGTYSVSLISSTGCTGIDSVNVIISDPSVNLGLNQTKCSNEALPVLNAGNPGSAYFWYLNGSSLPQTTQTLQTTGGGIYSATIINPYGCIASDSMTLTVLTAPAAAFTSPPSATVNTAVNFNDVSNPLPASWNWNFGDATPNVFIQSPTHTYTSAGIFPVFLIVGNGLCFDTATKTITILNDCATLGLDASFLLSADTVYLTDLGMIFTTNTSVNGVSYLWDFGDGNTSVEINSSNAYSTAGTYTITLTVTNSNCTDQATATVVVMNSPQGLYELRIANCHPDSHRDCGLRIYPNPFSNVATLETYKPPSLHIEKVSFFLYDIFGKRVKLIETEENLMEIHRNGLRNGLYFYRVLSENKTIGIGKIVIE